MTLFLRHGLAHVGQLSIPIAGGDPVEISLHPPKFRILLALRDALRDDTADPSVPESARGWRFPEPISRLVDGQPDVVLQHESGTVRSYISEMHRLIENTAAAMGLAESPSIFERVPRVGIRLAYSLIVRDLTGTIPP
jgi:hypothetical protein